jgi:hypothetical protein
MLGFRTFGRVVAPRDGGEPADLDSAAVFEDGAAVGEAGCFVDGVRLR